MRSERLVGPALGLAVVAISTAAVLVRLVPEVDPLAIAFWRTLGAALVLLPWCRSMGVRDLGWTVLASVFLALHFWAWFASLGLTSVLRSTVLVTLAPLWIGLLSWAFLAERPTRGFWVGVGVAVLGAAGLAAPGEGGGMRGDTLALVGGMLSSAYLVVGRSVRQRVSIGTYGTAVCGLTALWLGGLAQARGVPLTGFPAQTWAALGAMALGPQLLGHVGFNFAMRYVPASKVGVLVLLEPVGASILALLLLGEAPSAREILAGVVVLGGVGLALRR